MTATFLWQPERILNAKGSEGKKAEKKETGKKKNSERAIAKEKRSPNFGLCACTKLKYCTFL